MDCNFKIQASGDTELRKLGNYVQEHYEIFNAGSKIEKLSFLRKSIYLFGNDSKSFKIIFLKV